MTKVVLNVVYGGFSISNEAVARYAEITGNDRKFVDTYGVFDASGEHKDFDRRDPVLIQVVEELKDRSWGLDACLAVFEVPPGAYFRIHEYDGYESIEYRDNIDWMVGE